MAETFPPAYVCTTSTDSCETFKYESNGEMYLLTLNDPLIYCRSMQGEFIPIDNAKHDPDELSATCVEGDLLYIELNKKGPVKVWVGYKYKKCKRPMTNDEQDAKIRELEDVISEQKDKIKSLSNSVDLLLAKSYVDTDPRNVFCSDRWCTYSTKTTIIGSEYVSITLHIYNLDKVSNYEELRELVADYESRPAKIETLYIRDLNEYTQYHYFSDGRKPLTNLIRSIILNINMFPNLQHLEIGRAPVKGSDFIDSFNYDFKYKPSPLPYECFDAMSRSKLKTIKLGVFYGVLLCADHNDPTITTRLSHLFPENRKRMLIYNPTTLVPLVLIPPP